MPDQAFADTVDHGKHYDASQPVRPLGVGDLSSPADTTAWARKMFPELGRDHAAKNYNEVYGENAAAPGS